MKDLRRLRETDPQARALFEAARSDGPSEQGQRAAAAALGLGSIAATASIASAASAGTTALGVGSAAAAAAPGAAAVGGAGIGAGGFLAGGAVGKWLGVVALVGATAGGGYLASSAPRSDAPAAPTPAATLASTPSAAPAPTPVLTVARAVMPGPTNTVLTPAPPPPAQPRDVAPVTPTNGAVALPEPPPPAKRSASSLVAETAALDAARRALRAHDPAAALDALDGYARAFPDGSLAPEATVVRIEALSVHGEHARARALAARFLAEHPTSPLADRVRTLMAQEPTQ